MSHAALLSGMCLANSGLGMAHGVAAALGVHCGAAHGAACALMLPVALRVNRQVRAEQMADLARELFELPPETPEEKAVDMLVERIDQLCQEVGVPRRLGQLGVRREQIPDLVTASRGSSMSGNPRELADAELAELLGADPVILSAGLTPAWQQILVFEGFRYGEVNRAAEVHWCASGKVFNAGIGAARLGGPSLTLAVVGRTAAAGDRARPRRPRACRIAGS